MSLVFLIASVIFLLLFGVRWLRWLAVVQQKEYRWDRLWVYLRTSEGRRDVWQVLPTPDQLTPKGLKRPVRTLRLYATAAASLVLGAVLWLVAGGSWWVAVVIYVLQPVVIVVTLLPASLVRAWWVRRLLQQARQKLLADKPLVIGITGSYGKSSTKQLVAHVISQQQPVFMTPKSHNTRHSVAAAILSHYHHQAIAVIEYAAYTKGEIKALASWFQPDIAIITGLAPQHLSLFGSVAAIVEAKSELIKALKNSAQPGLVFYHAADPGAKQICDAGGAVEPVPFSGTESVVPVQHVGLNQDGLLSLVWRGHTISTQLVGLQNLAAVQAAVAVASYLGVAEPQIVAGLESFVPSEVFIQLKRNATGLRIYDDGGTSNPTGFKASLTLLESLKRNQKVVLITSGIIDLGDESSRVHRELAELALGVVDQVVYLGTPGLSEFQDKLGSRVVADSHQALQVVKDISSDCLVLIEGRVPRWVYHELGVTPR